jgi:phage portal protein BeeE
LRLRTWLAAKAIRAIRGGRERRSSSAAGLSAPGFTASLTVPSIAGVLVTPQTALTFLAWYAAIRVITEDLASLPFFQFQYMKGGGSKIIQQAPVSTLFNWSPDGECTSINWREAYDGHVCGWGNAYAEIDWDGVASHATSLDRTAQTNQRWEALL